MNKLFMALALITLPVAAQAQDITASSTSPVTERSILPAGQYFWDDSMGFQEAIHIQVNVATQMIYVFRGEYMIGAASISSGRDGKATPLGHFTILEKDKDHRSNLYNSAPMPYMMRLTWDGVALHTGRNPGYAASHGCVRLPDGFARVLFDTVVTGDSVEVLSERPTLNLQLAAR